ncbi:TFIIB-type zinc ribbon-containing protein [Vagococcus entomophilus]|uniref:ATP-binding protein n=1 Tax=Vagococcus entomophilus TaxID=1160095 RepID=A0A430AI72_9ENTE|nr:TFIIB-type zinc ribbon-containing protein [Vagococcus entomophilus]RSU07738.1 ATP-binding protein [Vagococcus entomophilus]
MSETVITHKCPNCDGPLLFDPKNQLFHCEYCGNTYTEADLFIQKKPTDSVATETKEPTNSTTFSSQQAGAGEASLFLCPSCGAEIVTDATTAATYCYYCHNPVVLSGRLSGEFLPQSLVPFQITKEEATENFLSWTRKKKFIPKDFFSKKQVENLTGVYFPYWNVHAELTGELSALANSVSVWVVGDVEYTQTKKFSLFRKGAISFKDLTKNALSKNTPQKMVEAVQPFTLEEALPFQTEYLAGFQAEKRDIEYASMDEEVKHELNHYSAELLSDTIYGYTTVFQRESSVDLIKQQQDYVLLPVWLVTYRSKGSDKKVYYYAMNGQTGKVSGVLPINKLKLGLFSAGVFLSVLILALIVGYLL